MQVIDTDRTAGEPKLARISLDYGRNPADDFNGHVMRPGGAIERWCYGRREGVAGPAVADPEPEPDGDGAAAELAVAA